MYFEFYIIIIYINLHNFIYIIYIKIFFSMAWMFENFYNKSTYMIENSQVGIQKL